MDKRTLVLSVLGMAWYEHLLDLEIARRRAESYGNEMIRLRYSNSGASEEIKEIDTRIQAIYTLLEQPVMGCSEQLMGEGPWDLDCDWDI